MRQGGWIRGSGDGNWGGNGDWNGDWNHLRCGVEGCGCVRAGKKWGTERKWGLGTPRDSVPLR